METRSNCQFLSKEKREHRYCVKSLFLEWEPLAPSWIPREPEAPTTVFLLNRDAPKRKRDRLSISKVPNNLYWDCYIILELLLSYYAGYFLPV